MASSPVHRYMIGMAELKTQRTAASVAAFLKTLPPDRRADCEAVVKLMRRATGARPAMWGDRIVGFGDYEYPAAGGKMNRWFLLGFSPRKQNLTLYLMAGFANYPALMKRLGKHKTGKSCLYLDRLADVDRSVLEELLAESGRATRAWGAKLMERLPPRDPEHRPRRSDR